MSDYKKERIFPILRKFDAEWSKSEETFCEMIKRVAGLEVVNKITDEELQDRLKNIEIK